MALTTNGKTEERAACQPVVSGVVQLTPIQQWFFADSMISAKHHYNQSVMLQFKERVSTEAVREIFSKIMEHHDALRMVFKTQGGEISQWNGPVTKEVNVQECDLCKSTDAAGKLLWFCRGIQSGFDLESGPLVKLGLFHLPNDSRLLVVIHHLVVDAVSWQIILEDIDTLYRQLQSGQPLVLPPKTSSYQSWSDQLQQYTRSLSFHKASQHWNNVLSTPFPQIPRDHARADNRYYNSQWESRRLTAVATRRLLTQAHHSFNTNVDELLLAALVLSVNKQYGVERLRIDLQGHGREDIGGAVDVSRTVGWFTCIYPVMLEMDNTIGGTIKNVKEAIRRVPNNGVDYLLKKYRERSTARERSSRVSFNYLRQVDADKDGRSFVISEEPRGEEVGVTSPADYDWDFISIVKDGRLQVSLRYSAKQYKEVTIGRLMTLYCQCLGEVIEYCCMYGKRELRSSDITYADLGANRLDEL